MWRSLSLSGSKAVVLCIIIIITLHLFPDPVLEAKTQLDVLSESGSGQSFDQLGGSCRCSGGRRLLVVRL